MDLALLSCHVGNLVMCLISEEEYYCKTALMLVVSRIKLLKNKREANMKKLKSELAQLIQSSRNDTARIKVEHAINEEKTMAAYDLIEIYCQIIAARISMIESQRNCPMDLKEAISSVIFASGRCSDIPELLNVRNHIMAKYGKQFVLAAIELRPDCAVNRLANGPTKIKTLTAIAQEYNVKWQPSLEENDRNLSQDLQKDAYVPGGVERGPPGISNNSYESASYSKFSGSGYQDMENISAMGGESWNKLLQVHAAAESAERAAMAAIAAAQLSKPSSSEHNDSESEEIITSTKANISKVKAGHVHPKLPHDYDAFVAHMKEDESEIDSITEVGRFANAVVVKEVGEETFHICRELIDGVVIVSRDSIYASIKDVVREKMILGLASALTLARAKAYCKEMDNISKLGVIPNQGILQSEGLLKYILETGVFPREAKTLKDLRDATAKHPLGFMGAAPDAGQLIALLLKLLNAKKTIEIGVFTGYSLLLTALTIPHDGKIIAMDPDREAYETGLPFIKKAGVEQKIDFIASPAKPVLDKLLEHDVNVGSFDFAFVDADKNNYWNYHERLMKLVKIGGIIAYDNTLWGGTVALPEKAVSESKREWRKLALTFNNDIAKDCRVEIAFLSIGDGIIICRRLH
ncbi:hypothetical protein RJT34_04641 [Clitoria ternatea]|uniref:Caffeoyl-CoA O-methyltransferase n=1 Tax=Clitoria ternatea TaxID=43366 RepID=A0AAN9KPP5_CLITE